MEQNNDSRAAVGCGFDGGTDINRTPALVGFSNAVNPPLTLTDSLANSL